MKKLTNNYISVDYNMFTLINPYIVTHIVYLE